jgi:hypothetical protein
VPQFVLIPGFETLTLLLVASAFGDRDGVIIASHFLKADWEAKPNGYRIRHEFPLGSPMALFLRDFHNLRTDATLEDCLSLSQALSDRSPTLFDELRKFDSILYDVDFFPTVLSDFNTCDLPLHFFTTDGAFEQTLIFMEGAIGGETLLAAVPVYDGCDALFRDGDGRVRPTVPAANSAKLEHLSDNGGCDDFFCLWAIGAIDGRPTLALFLRQVFYVFGDRETRSYARDGDAGRRVLEQLRCHIVCYARASSVGVSFEERASGGMQPGYETSIYDPVRSLTAEQVARWSGEQLTFSEFVTLALHFPACFASRFSLPADAPIADYAFALVLSDGAADCRNVVAFAQHLFPAGKSGLDGRRRQAAFTEAVAALVNAYADFTHFVYHLIDFLRVLQTGDAARMRSLLSALLSFIPFESALLFETITLWLIQIAAEKPVLRTDIGVALAVIVTQDYFTGVGGNVWSPRDLAEWSRRQPGHIFQMQAVECPLTVRAAVAAFDAAIANCPALDDISRASVKRPPRVTEEFRSWAKKVILRPAIVL